MASYLSLEAIDLIQSYGFLMTGTTFARKPFRSDGGPSCRIRVAAVVVVVICGTEGRTPGSLTGLDRISCRRRSIGFLFNATSSCSGMTLTYRRLTRVR